MSTGLGVHVPHQVGITKQTAVMRQVTDRTSSSLVKGVHTVCLQRSAQQPRGGKKKKKTVVSSKLTRAPKLVYAGLVDFLSLLFVRCSTAVEEGVFHASEKGCALLLYICI